MSKKQRTYLNFKILLKSADHHLSLHQVITFLLVESLKYVKNYPNVTQRREVSKCCWEKWR